MKFSIYLVITFFNLVFISCAPKDQLDKYQGDWFGVLNLGESKFNMALQVNSKDKNASFYIVDPKAEVITVDTMHIEDDSLKIAISEIEGAYKCVYYKYQLYGKWKLANGHWVDMTIADVCF